MLKVMINFMKKIKPQIPRKLRQSNGWEINETNLVPTSSHL
jgi:hypothetical protein